MSTTPSDMNPYWRLSKTLNTTNQLLLRLFILRLSRSWSPSSCQFIRPYLHTHPSLPQHSPLSKGAKEVGSRQRFDSSIAVAPWWIPISLSSHEQATWSNRNSTLEGLRPYCRQKGTMLRSLNKSTIKAIWMIWLYTREPILYHDRFFGHEEAVVNVSKNRTGLDDWSLDW